MGKKKNKKLKRILRAQALQSIENRELSIERNTNTQEQKEYSENTTNAERVVSRKEAEVIQLTEDKKDVRHEIKKILITIAVLVLIIVAVDLVNNKTDMILKAGQFVAEKLNLNL